MNNNVPPGYKKTEVGVIPEEWEAMPLGLLGTWKGGATPSMQNPAFWFDGTVPWVSSGDIKSTLISDAPMKITEIAVKQSSTTLLPANSVMVVTRSGILRKFLPVAKNLIPIAINQDIKALIPDESAVSDYLLHVLIGNGNRVLATCLKSGTTVESIEYPWLKRYLIPLPPLPEQRAIAAALSDVDALIASLDKLIAKKRDMKQAAMQELLTGKRRMPGFATVGAIHELPLQGHDTATNNRNATTVGARRAVPLHTGNNHVIPHGWEVKRLGDVCEISMGRTPSRRNPAYWGKGYKWLSIADLQQKVISESKEEITELAASEMPIIPKGTLLMSFKLSIGRLCFAGCDLFTNEAICSFNKLQANADYLYYALGRVDFSLYGKQAVKGYTLNKESLKLVEVSYPPLPEQTSIAAILSDMDTEIAALEQKRDKTRLLKQGMMQELLTGRIRLV